MTSHTAFHTHSGTSCSRDLLTPWRKRLSLHTAEFNSCACQTAPAREDAPSGGSAVTKKGEWSHQEHDKTAMTHSCCARHLVGAVQSSCCMHAGLECSHHCCVVRLRECACVGDSPASQQTPDGEVVKAASKKIAIPVPEAGERVLLITSDDTLALPESCPFMYHRLFARVSFFAG